MRGSAEAMTAMATLHVYRDNYRGTFIRANLYCDGRGYIMRFPINVVARNFWTWA
jgi:hypothetical protein